MLLLARPSVAGITPPEFVTAREGSSLARANMIRSEDELPRRKKIPSSSSAPAGLNGLRGRRIEDGPILVGICAMDQKARAAPMTEMLNRLTSFTASGLVEFKVVYFGNETLLNQPVEEWPLCEALIAFYSTGFPLQKAQEYVALRPNPSPSPSPSPSLSPSPSPSPNPHPHPNPNPTSNQVSGLEKGILVDDGPDGTQGLTSRLISDLDDLGFTSEHIVQVEVARECTNL